MGIVERIFVAPERGSPMVELREVAAATAGGLAGDRYADPTVRRSPKQEITLIEAEHIEAFATATGLAMGPAMPRRNVVTRDVRLNEMVGRRFRVGAVLLEGIELCEPCRLFAARTHKEALPFFAGKGGLRATIIAGGVLAVGYAVREDA